jgi:hypothetical protein
MKLEDIKRGAVIETDAKHRWEVTDTNNGMAYLRAPDGHATCMTLDWLTDNAKHATRRTGDSIPQAFALEVRILETGDVDKLAAKVTAAILEGWSLWGGPAVALCASEGMLDRSYIQAMTRTKVAG